MRLYTKSFNQKNDLEDYVNSRHIQKEDIVSVFQDNSGQFVLYYYGE